MKKQLLLLVMVLLPIVASAQEIDVKIAEGVFISYRYINNGEELEVIYFTNDYKGNFVIPEEVTYMNKTLKVTSIGENAFKDCYSLSSITIPNSVTNIGENAFKDCHSLTSITIPNSVTNIGGHAFEECRGLTSITIPNSVISIGGHAFASCRGLTSITIPNSVTSIGEYAFAYCFGLTSITIPNSVTSIGHCAFTSSEDLISIKVESGNITYDSRNNCNAIIETANNELLCGCKNTVIPNSVTSIGDRAFYCCSGLTSITIPNSVTSIGELAFSNCLKLASVTIPNSVTSISTSAFNYCSNITSVNISCEVIDPWFCSRTSLTEITLGRGVKIVKENAFKGCTNIKTIDIGSTVTSIEARAFSGTDMLTDVTCRATTVPETDKTAFEYSYPNYAKLHVPAVSQTTYKETAPWSEFKEIVPIIQDLPDDAEQCATPTISYQKGKLSFACITEGVEYQYQITDNDIKIGAGAEISLDATYHISVYATKNGYKDSKISTATLCWIDKNPTTEGITDNVANISANAVLIQNVGGMLSVTGVPAGTAINVYDLSGKKTGSAKASSETTNIATTLRSGEVGILKIGDKSIKYLVH